MGGVIVAFVILGVLAFVLEIWAESLIEDEIEGTWVNSEGDWIKFNSDKSGSGSGDWSFDGWIIQGSELGFCVDEPDSGCDDSIYYTWEYEVKGDVLFIAPHEDLNGNIDEDGCEIWVKSGEPYSSTASSESTPYWCDA